MENIMLIAIALSLDAFGVALGLGCGKKLRVKERTLTIISFGFFQFFFALAGALLGSFVNSNLFKITGLLSGGIILIMGILFLKEGFEHRAENGMSKELSFWSFIILGISVSIDALGIGFSVLYSLNYKLLLSNSIIIGLITSLLTAFSLLLARYIRNFYLVERYADYLGGIILVMFALQMIF